MFGSVTVKKVRQPEAPRVSAASSSALPCSCITGISSRATKGKVTNIVARTMPGTAKTICTPCAISQAPTSPCAPKSSTKQRPATTGETENGRSMKVMRKALPRKSNLAIAQAAATPKTALSGTAMAAAISVSWIAARTSGLAKEATASAKPFGQRLREDRDQRREEDEREHAEHGRDQRDPQPVGFGASPRGESAAELGDAGVISDVGHQLPSLLRLQTWTRLIARSIAKEIASIAIAMATAPS